MTRFDFNAVNARGVVVRSFSTLDLARAWVREHAADHAGLHAVCVTTTIRAEVVYRPRAHLRIVA